MYTCCWASHFASAPYFNALSLTTQLEVPEDELIRRVRAIAAAEAAAAAAAATLSTAPTGKATSARGASSKPVSAKGGPLSTAGGTLSGDKGGAVAGVVGSHNNEKDWCRRMEAYKQLIQEDSADLAANVSDLQQQRLGCQSCQCVFALAWNNN